MKLKKLKRKDFSLFRKHDKYCGICGMVLGSPSLEMEGFYDCPKCKLRRWPKPSIQYPPLKYQRHWVEEKDTIAMRKRMDDYLVQASIRLKQKVIIYTAKERDQEFLRSLIPKK